MNTFSRIALCALAPAIACVSLAQSSKPTLIAQYLPIGELVQGVAVRPALDEGVNEYHKKFDAAASKLTQEQIKEIQTSLKPGYPIPYDERICGSKEEYAKYLVEWNKKKVVAIADVVGGLMPASGAPGMWYMASSSKESALPISTLKYDADNDVWISPNGKLVRKNDVSFEETYNLGAWSGKEWLMETENAFGKTVENILLGKTKDGEFTYVIYNLIEVDTLGQLTQQPLTIVLRFPASPPKAADAPKAAAPKADPPKPAPAKPATKPAAKPR